MQVVLAMFRSDGERRSFSVTRDATIIGRRQDCDLRIPLGEVSRKHCRLTKDKGQVHVEDLGSSNGTYVNGQRVPQADLQPGDSLQVGPVVFVVQIDGFPDDDDLRPISREEVDGAQPAPADASGSEVGNSAPAAGEEGLIGFDPMDALNEADKDDSAASLAAEEEMAKAAADIQAAEGDQSVSGVGDLLPLASVEADASPDGGSEAASSEGDEHGIELLDDEQADQKA
jgi:pSer/pThr/pTyr-binding forkhead associated (FHA) protein